jgi:hypothetical protein
VSTACDSPKPSKAPVGSEHVSATSLPKVSLAALPSAWRERAALLRRYGGGAQAEALEQCALDLELVARAEQNFEVDLRTAARLSGYSGDHLRRLSAQGKVTARRHGRRLLFKVGDLPRRGNTFDDARGSQYDPTADARQVIARRSRGALHDTQTTTNSPG